MMLAQLFQEALNVHTVDAELHGLARAMRTTTILNGAVLLVLLAAYVWNDHKLRRRVHELESRLPEKSTAPSS